MDRFGVTVTNGNVVIDTAVGRPGPGDRREHHRPRGRRSALHRRRRIDTDGRARNRPTSRGSSSSSLVLGWLVYAGVQRPRRAQPRSAPRSSWPPTASSTTTTRRSRARSSSAPSCSPCCCLGVIALSLPLYWLFEPQRQANATDGCDERLRRLGGRAVRHHGQRRLQLRRLPRWHEGHRRRRRDRDHRSEDRRGQGGQLERAGAEHRALPLQRGRGHLHPRLRPAVLADVPVGPRRWRPDERPADRDPHRVHQEHPDPADRLHSPRSRSSATPPTRRSATAVSSRPRTQQAIQDQRRAGCRRRHVRLGRRGAVQPRPQYRCLLLRPVPHERVVATATRASPGQGAMGWNLTGGSTNTRFADSSRHDRLHQGRLAVRQEVRQPGPGQRSDAGLRPACSPTSRSPTSSNTSGASDR